jgi:hypothetical protein
METAPAQQSVAGEAFADGCEGRGFGRREADYSGSSESAIDLMN